ncbi:MAG: malonate transporter subunit MadM, partial [Pseudomonadales bacterium]|nr:malonate transporter subunit MadM [Pseudomonadales bacterium]
MTETLIAVLSKNALITAFAVVGIIIWLSYWLSDRISAGRIHGSAIA